MPWVIAFAGPAGWGVEVEGRPPVLAGAAADADGHELTVTPLAAATVAERDGELAICRVTAGAFEATGVRWPGEPEVKLESARLVTASFSPEHAVGLAAVRPTGAKGQERDVVAAASLGEREGAAVFDPRLSTTYTGDGEPRRVGIELWLGETEEGEQYPHRVAAETTGEPLVVDSGGLELRAYGLTCHSRGENGTGVYVLIRPR